MRHSHFHEKVTESIRTLIQLCLVRLEVIDRCYQASLNFGYQLLCLVKLCLLSNQVGVLLLPGFEIHIKGLLQLGLAHLLRLLQLVQTSSHALNECLRIFRRERLRGRLLYLNFGTAARLQQGKGGF